LPQNGSPGYWNSPRLEGSGLFYLPDQFIKGQSSADPYGIPEITESRSLIITSDYSREHKTATHQVISILITSLEHIRPWNHLRERLRKNILGPNRRMSFKDLRDKKRQEALIPFLRAADILPGLSLTIAINNSISSIFTENGPVDLGNPDFAELRSLTPKTLEKAFRVAHLVSLVTAGISKPNQDIMWLTDEDAIAPNNSRIILLTKLWGWVLSGYLGHNLGHIKCGSTQSDDGSRVIEDLTSIPDLIAGAVSEQFIVDAANPGAPTGQVFWLQRPDYSPKTHLITQWLVRSEAPLRRLVARLDPVPGSNSIMVSNYHF
jgi:hypothetical protein